MADGEGKELLRELTGPPRNDPLCVFVSELRALRYRGPRAKFFSGTVSEEAVLGRRPYAWATVQTRAPARGGGFRDTARLARGSRLCVREPCVNLTDSCRIWHIHGSTHHLHVWLPHATLGDVGHGGDHA